MPTASGLAGLGGSRPCSTLDGEATETIQGTMELLRVTVLLLLSSLCNSEQKPDVTTATPKLPSTNSTTTSTPTPSTVPLPNTVITSTSPKGGNSSELLNASLVTTVSSFITVKSEELGTTANGSSKNESSTTSATVTNPPLSNAVSTLQSFQHKTENQSTIKTTKITGNTPPPDTSPSRTRILPSIAATIAENNVLSQGTEDGKNASSASTSPSYSSIILPVVIALIVITLSVFALVALYRMCWKKDPGTPENGNDQPQSDKESVKLLTVKTISHESGEHSAHGKTKN
ncbi:endomucin [Eulemur rufifrons]|uniref:endomucin n=1 Tax=Eulemur rufifrons TaxID=859984 RepID=UPI0037428E7A